MAVEISDTTKHYSNIYDGLNLFGISNISILFKDLRKETP
jgi:hypothetical protein